MHRIVEGIVLRETETKETDKILTVLTRTEGKLAVVARGARRRRSRIAAAAQLTKGVAEEKDFLLRWIDVMDFQ